MSKGDYIEWCVYPCVCVLLCHFAQTNTTQQQWLQLPDMEIKVAENHSHKTAQCIISQTPEPEGAWLWRFITAYWIIWINLTHLGLCVFLSSQLSRLLVSDNCTKWVISFWAPLSFLPPFVVLAFSTSLTKFGKKEGKKTFNDINLVIHSAFCRWKPWKAGGWLRKWRSGARK